MKDPGASRGKPFEPTARRPAPTVGAHPRSRVLRRAIVAMVVALALVGTAMWFVDRNGSSGAPSTTAPPGASPGASAGAASTCAGGGPAAGATEAPSGSPGSSLDPAVAAQIEVVKEQVPAIRGLRPIREVRDRVLDEAGLRGELERSFRKENPVEQLAGQTALLTRLGLLPAGTDLQSLVVGLLGSQVLGFYDDSTCELTVIARAGGFGPLERVTLAHEYTHALQDQHFGLGSLGREDVTEGDRTLARLALIEGDATLLMSQWARARLTGPELAQVGSAGNLPAQQEALARAPAILQRQLEFPYSDGLLFAAQLFGRGGWEAIDRAYGELPDSTEQILHFDKYLAHERPISVELPPVETTMGSGWRRTAIDTFGELNTRVWLDQALDPGAASAAAEGWGGDRLASYDGPKGAWALAWQSAWDSEGDRDAFLSGAQATLSKLGGLFEIRTAQGNGVRILRASDAPTLDLLRRGFGG